MTKEEMEKQIHGFAEMMYKTGYEDGYKNGIADGNINDGTFAKKIQEAYENGLKDAWECAWKMIIANAADEAWIFEKYSVSEALAKIKEYEDKHKCKECTWDEFRDAQSPVGTPCDSCFEGKNFSPKVAINCSYLEDECPYDVKCEECEIRWSIERAKQKLKGDKE